jgi:hypothetical protein
MMTSNLNTDYDGIFANKADIVAMIIAEKDINNKRIDGIERYIYFRPDGYIDAGSRFPNIVDKVELSAENYINAVTDAIKKSITNHKVDDKYLAQKQSEEQHEKEEYYNVHKEEIMTGDSLDNEIKKKKTLRR